MSNTFKQSYSRRDILRAMGLGTAGMALAACAAPIVPVAPAAPAASTGAGSAAAPEQAFLNYWTGWSGFEFDALQAQVDKFNEANDDVFVNMTTVFGQYEKVLTAIAGGNPPDVVSAVWLRQLISMAARGGLTPVTSYADAADIDGSEYFPQFWDAWHWNNELWGLMITSNSSVIAYQPALFEEVGIEGVPQTIAELDAAAEALETVDASGNIDRVGLLPAGLRWWGRVFGGNLYDEENKKITANDPGIVAALEWLGSYRSRLGPEKVAAFTSGFGDYMSTQNSFFVGKEAMTQVGEWFIQFQKKFAPDLVMEFTPAPAPEGGRANCTIFDGSVFTIPSGVKAPDASWEFIRWLSEAENMGNFCYDIQNIPPKLAPASEERFVSDPRFQLAVDLLNGANAFGPDKMPVNDLLYTRLDEAQSEVFEGQMSAQEALDRVTEEVQKELDRTLERM
jgi:multiple sugar transport system substrate-binding protein